MNRSLPYFVAASFVLATLPSPGDVSYEVLDEFERPGAQPLAPLLLHSDRDYYGTTAAGGACGHGSVFRLTASGELTTLLSFTGDAGSAPGHAPIGALTAAGNGDLYGTTSGGGAHGFGVAFRLTTAGQFTPLLDFTGRGGPNRGSVPGSLTAHPDGNLYGTTQAGGTDGFGTVFRLSPAGVLTTLAEFSGADGSRPGSRPVGPLAVDGAMLYGVTREGGSSNDGTAFELSTSGSYRLLATFDAANGSLPSALVHHSDGLLYGTAEFGGASDFGSAFSLSTGANPTLNVLHSFDDPQGSQPVGQLVEDADGDLRGVTALGGAQGWGVIFKCSIAGAYSVLHEFTGTGGTTPGAESLAGLTANPDGTFLGVTSAGGPANLGSAFRIETDGSFQNLANFSLPGGWFPSGSPRSDAQVRDLINGMLFPVAAGGEGGGGAILHLVPGAPATVAAALSGALGESPAGALLGVGSDFFGVTSHGGGQGRGTAFKYTVASGASLTATYRNVNGSAAAGPLVSGSDGALYGVAREGGASGQGTVYRLTVDGVRSRLVSFTGLAGSAPGRAPCAPLATAADGTFYGVTEQGGAANAGVLFKVSLTGEYTLLDEFAADGPRLPQGGLAAGPNGFLYGTTSLGGAANAGTVIRIDPATDTWSELGSFTDNTGAALGRSPAGPLEVGPDGTLYGITTAGGPSGHGGIFSLPPAGALESVLMFSGESGPTPGRGEAIDGPSRFLGGLRLGLDNVLYGLAPAGGTKGGGVAFRINLLSPLAQWKLTHLGGADAPDAGDPDFDGLSSLLEYGLLLLPELSDAAQQPRPLLRTYPEGDRLSVLVPRDPSRHDITVRVEASATLQPPWELLAESTNGQPFSGPGVVGGDSPTPGLKSVEIRDLVNSGSIPRRFLRITVSTP